ncbi:MAG: hypothetical protein V3T05_08730, partial [Myxococcota bacterium]
TISGTSISLAGSGTELGIDPCAAVGLALVADTMRIVVSDSTVTIGDDFTLAGGIFAGLEDPTASSSLELTSSSIAVGSTHVSAVCLFLNTLAGSNDEAPGGSIGVALFGGLDATLTNNQISVGESNLFAFGLIGLGTGRLEITDNTVIAGTVGSSTLSLDTTAASIHVGPSDPANPSRIARNRFVAQGGSLSTSGFYITGGPHIEVTNNFIHGGFGIHTRGMTFLSDEPDPEWPKFTHNTIFAGGDPSTSLTSRAVTVVIEKSQTTGLVDDGGVFQHNLVDAGGAGGRRTLVANGTEGLFAAMQNNVFQFDGFASGPRPTHVATRELILTGQDSPTYVPGWLAFMEGSGELTLYLDFSPFLVPFFDIPVPGRPTATWFGLVGSVPWAVVATEGNIAVSTAAGIIPGEFSRFSSLSFDGTDFVEHEPMAVAAGYVRGAQQPSIFLLEPPGGAALSGLWIMNSAANGAFSPPTLALGMVDPKALTFSSAAQIAIAVDGTTLRTHPDRPAVDISTKLAAGSAADITRVSFERINEELLSGGKDMPDLIVIGDGELYVWLNAKLLASNALLTTIKDPVLLADPPCGAVGSYAASAVTLAEPGQMVDSAGERNHGLLIGCDDGRLEFFTLQPLPIRLVRAADPAGTGGPVTGIASDGRALVSRADSHELEVFSLDTSGTSNILVSDSYQALLADIVVRDPKTFLLTDDFARLSETLAASAAPGENLPCPLELHRPGGDRYDMHLLDSGSNYCIDPSPSGVAAMDGDGCARDDGTRDIGADEFGADAPACQNGP